MGKGIDEEIKDISQSWNNYIGKRVEEFIKRTFTSINNILSSLQKKMTAAEGQLEEARRRVVLPVAKMVYSTAEASDVAVGGVVWSAKECMFLQKQSSSSWTPGVSLYNVSSLESGVSSTTGFVPNVNATFRVGNSLYYVEGGEKLSDFKFLPYAKNADVDDLKGRVQVLENLLKYDKEKGTSVLDNAVFGFPVEEDDGQLTIDN